MSGRRRFVALVAIAGSIACSHRSPIAPADLSLAGVWQGAMTGRGPCVGDWTAFTLTLHSSGAGELVTNDSQHFDALQIVDNGVTRIDVSLPPGPGGCQTLSLAISVVERDEAGRAAALSGEATGRCCGTIMTPYRLSRA